MTSDKSSQQPDVMKFRAHSQYFNALWHFYDIAKYFELLISASESYLDMQELDLIWNFKKMF